VDPALTVDPVLTVDLALSADPVLKAVSSVPSSRMAPKVTPRLTFDFVLLN